MSSELPHWNSGTLQTLTWHGLSQRPSDSSRYRNRRRDRNVPEDVMQRMAAKLRPPKFEEGFAKITVVRLKKKDAEDPGTAPQALKSEPDEGEPPEMVDSED